jgi:hypothetical protein
LATNRILQLLENWYIRASVGRTYVDLGGKKTNTEVDNKMDAMIGLVHQFSAGPRKR